VRKNKAKSQRFMSVGGGFSLYNYLGGIQGYV